MPFPAVTSCAFPFNMNKLPDDFLSLLSNASITEKRAMLIALSKSIREDESAEVKNIPKLRDYVDYVPSFVKDSELIDGIQDELNSMGIDAPAHNSKKVKTFWLNSTSHSYAYTGSVNKAHLISDYENINKLLKIINTSEYGNNELNS